MDTSHIFREARVWKVFAGPGCGKTWFIEQSINGLLNSGVRPEEIMYILFNSSPAQQFRGRYEDQGVAPEEMTWWGTHHSICRKLAKVAAKNILNTEQWGKEHGFPMSSEEEIKERGIDQYGWDVVFSSMSRKIYEADGSFTKEEQRLLDALKETEYVSGKYCHVRYMQKALGMNMFPQDVRYVFVDEAQDNGKMQYNWIEFIRGLESVEGLLLAGDDKQAINDFKGGNSKLFLDFKADKVLEITKTHRLPRAILKEANRVIEPVKNRSSLTLETSKTTPGRILYTNDLSECVADLRDALKARKTVMALVRNRNYIPLTEHVLGEHLLPYASAWYERAYETIMALQTIRTDDGLRGSTLERVMPKQERNIEGMLGIGHFWEKGAITRFRKGDFIDHPEIFEAYEVIRLGGILPLDRCLDLGFKQAFIDSVRAWDFKPETWNLSPDNLFRFKSNIRECGHDAKPIRVATIHSVKGEEADVVVLIGNVTQRTFSAELEDEDAERRVWYVGETRAKETLIKTFLHKKTERTNIIL